MQSPHSLCMNALYLGAVRWTLSLPRGGTSEPYVSQISPQKPQLQGFGDFSAVHSRLDGNRLVTISALFLAHLVAAAQSYLLKTLVRALLSPYIRLQPAPTLLSAPIGHSK